MTCEPAAPTDVLRRELAFLQAWNAEALRREIERPSKVQDGTTGGSGKNDWRKQGVVPRARPVEDVVLP